jgi:3-keto-5-aminohexanoate cleavage enzyme
VYSPAEQIAVVKTTKPEAVSLALRELVPDETHEPDFAELMSWMKRENVFPQIILYDPSEAVRLSDMQRRGLIPWNTIPVLFVLGRYTINQTSQPSDLLPFLAPGIPCFDHWSVCAFGRNEAACVTTAALLGGHVRVGFENNILLPDGRLAAGNADLVRGVGKTLNALGNTLENGAGLRHSLSRLLT